MEKQAHLLYLTGLSVDKVRMNNITENINFDKDFSYWLQKSQKNMNNIFTKKNKRLGKIKNLSEKAVNKFLGVNIADFIIDFDIFSDDSLLDDMDKIANAEAESKITNKFTSKVIKPFSKFVFDDAFGYKSNQEILKYHKEFFSLIEKYQTHIKSYVNGDFFSLYISNQSDSIGVQPLSKLSQRFPFTVEHAYCDWSYYDNQYIDHIVFKIEKNKLQKNWEKELQRTFKIHINDILFSKTIYDNDYLKQNNNQKNNGLKSLADLILKDNERYSKQDVLHTLSDRNFFGVSLLSQIIYTLEKLIVNSSVDINIEEKFTSNQFHFLKELLEMSTNTKIGINNNSSTISSKIYFSNGLKLSKSIDELINDEFFLYTNYTQSEDSLINLSEDEKREYISKISASTISYENNESINYIHTASDGHEYVYIKVPIKMMLSLPLSKEGKVNSDLYLPECLVSSKDKVIDILTVGGAEHNRALSHLINKHRLKYQDKRLFGFMDNYFDFEHKIQLDSSKKMRNSFNFFMGLNQPVAGWNFILDKKEEDDETISSNSDVKFITFKLEEKNIKINLVSIYGFSAIASELGINIFIAEMKRNLKKIKRGESLFSDNFSSIFKSEDIFKSRGTTATIFFYKNLADIYEYNEHPKTLYKNIQIILKNFSTENKKLLLEKLREVESLFVTKENPKKYTIVIDYEEIKDEMANLTLEDIRLRQIKFLVKFFFDNQCYQYVFNNDPRQYSKILDTEDNKNNLNKLLIMNIQHGRVTTKNE